MIKRRKKKFEPNVWIKFELERVTIVGRTFKTPDNQKIVAIVDALGNIGHLPWEQVQYADNLSKLTFLPTENESIMLSEQKPIIVNGMLSFIGKNLPEA